MFEVGDIVRKVRGGALNGESQDWSFELQVGQKYEVAKISGGGIEVKGSVYTIDKDHFEIARRAPCRFKVGDKVVVKHSGHSILAPQYRIKGTKATYMGSESYHMEDGNMQLCGNHHGTFMLEQEFETDEEEPRLLECGQQMIGRKEEINKPKFDRLAQVIMPDGHRQAILEALCQESPEKRNKLFNEWGFGDALEKGKGLTFLFFGPPGTGKTMCAQALVDHLGKAHVMLGTAELQSSVPGQMERNIKKAFADATAKNQVLILDECDSLLYSRDKVGMILAAEINCLLSEIEKHEGVCILTTNRNLLLDPALERRIALKLKFDKPDAKSRKQIWQVLTPKTCPLAEDVDMDRLASFDLTGGMIKNTLLAAARRAVHKDQPHITMDDFTTAIEKELEGQRAFAVKGDAIHRTNGHAPKRDALDDLLGDNTNGKGRNNGS